MTAARLGPLLAAGDFIEAEDLTRTWLLSVKRHVEGVEATALVELGRGRPEAAYRWNDRGVRITRRSSAAWSLHGLTCLRAGRNAEAEGAFRRALAYQPQSADAVSGLVLALGRQDPARAHAFLTSFLQHAVVPPGGALAKAATDVGKASEGAISGWIGRAGGWCLTGWLAAGRSATDIRLQLNGFPVTADTVTVEEEPDESGVRFTLTVRPQLGGCTVDAAVDGRALLGSGFSIQARHLCDGAVWRTDTSIAGWVRDAGEAGPIEIAISDFQGKRVVAQAHLPAADSAPGEKRPFKVVIAESGLNDAVLLVEAGPSRIMLDGSPLLGEALPIRLPPPSRALRGLGSRRLRRPVATILIVQDSAGDAVGCLTTLIPDRPADSRLIIVDDGCASVTQAAELRRLAAEHGFAFDRHPSPEGLARSLNRAIKAVPEHDVVLIDAGTLITGTLERRLAEAAYRDSGVGTVSALSNDAGPLSYPSHAPMEDKWDDEPLPAAPPSWLELTRRDASCRTALGGQTVATPIASEFCLYIRRDCLEQIGPFEENAFGLGTGAITDFCARASARGWRHQVALDVYVGHPRQDDGDPETGRRRRAAAAMGEARNPGSIAAAARWATTDPLRVARRALDLAQLADPKDQPATLLITAALGGGVARHVAECRKRQEQEGRRTIELRSDGTPEKPGRAHLVDPKQPDLVDLDFHLDIRDDETLLLDTLRRLRVAAIEIHHTIGYPPSIFDLPHQLALPYDVFLHDYAWICPQVVLVDETRRYCGEPATSACEKCLATNGSKIGPLASVADLRQRSQIFLEGARTVRVATQEARQRLLRYAPAAKIMVAGWDESKPTRPTRTLQTPRAERRRRVAVIGGIAAHKGYEVLLQCAEDAAARDLPLEFVLIGYSKNDPALFATDRVFVTGPYDDSELPALLEREQPDLAFFPSVWPETWCYAMSRTWEAGQPFLAFDQGAIGERVRQHGGGFLMPLTLDPVEINDRLLQPPTVLSELPPQRDRSPPVPSQPRQQPAEPAPPARNGTQPVHSQHFEVSVQVFPVNPGVYSLNLTHRKVPSVQSFGLTVPCMHIGTPPGADDQASPVELISMSDSRKNWLTEPGDVVVVKVSRPGGHLIATTYALPHQPKGALSFQMRRLDERGTAVRQEVKTEIILHVERAGDQRFTGGWAGFKDRGLRVEAFSIRPIEKLAPSDLEFMAYGALRRETPWVTGEKFCGSRGQGIALLGFSVRVAAKERNRFDVVYEAAFREAGVVGPKQNGEPCVSPREDDVLEGMRVQLLERVTT